MRKVLMKKSTRQRLDRVAQTTRPPAARNSKPVYKTLSEADPDKRSNISRIMQHMCTEGHEPDSAVDLAKEE